MEVPGYYSVSSSRSDSGSNKRNDTLAAEIPGDIILGGLFPVHMSNRKLCDEVNTDRGVQRLEAMLFTIDEINSRPDILPGISLGARILDTCSKETYALEQALEFVKVSLSDPEATGETSSYYCEGGGVLKRRGAKIVQPIRGVIGSAYSSVSIQVANLLRLFTIPMISYASTSARLSEKKNHPFFARTLPSDESQARAMAALVAYYNWTFVSTVRSSGDYGDSGISAFWKEGNKLGVCIAAREVIKQHTSPADIDAIVKVLYKDFRKARVVVLFTRIEDTKMLLKAVRNANLSHHFVWIAADGWGRESVALNKDPNDVASGALTFEIMTKEITNFTTYFQRLSQHTNKRNPWFGEYWQKTLNCSKVCPQGQLKDNKKDFQQESKIQFVYDAVYTFAIGLHKVYKEVCTPGMKPSECVARINSFDGSAFYNMLITSQFTDKYDNLVRFDEKGDGVGSYTIYNYVWNPVSATYQYDDVGTYLNSTLYINKPISWTVNTTVVPSSICSEDCLPGQIKKYNKDQRCCWICDTCKENEYRANETHCLPCMRGWWPADDKSKCYILESDSTSNELNSSVNRLSPTKKQMKSKPVKLALKDMKPKIEDQESIFGAHIASQLRNIHDPHQKIICKRLISETIYQAQLNDLDTTSYIAKNTSYFGQLYDN